MSDNSEQRERGGGSLSPREWLDARYGSTPPVGEWQWTDEIVEAYASSRLAAPPHDYISGLDKALEIVDHALDADKFLDGTAHLPTACWSITERIAQAILKERAIRVKGNL